MVNRNTQGMTLIELLVVMSILVVLASIISYTLKGAQDAAGRTQCLSNIRALGQCALLYAQEDPFGKFPFDPSKNTGLLFGKLYDPLHFSDLNVYVCPTKNREGAPSKPGVTPPYAILPITNNSYRFVLNTDGSDSQTLSFPSMNILLIENYSVIAPLYSEGYNHGKSGNSVFMINGKTRLMGSKNTAIPDNFDRSNTAYALKPSGVDSNFGT